MREASKPTTSSRSGQLRQRGKCPVCGYSVSIRKNGYAERHYLYASKKWTCPGGEEMRTETDTSRHPLAEWLL